MEEKKNSTIFVDNLPQFYDRYLLKKLFRGTGRVLDVHLPWRRREKKNTRFGFVIFEREEEAEGVLRKMNGIIIFGHKLSLEKTFNGGNSKLPMKEDQTSSWIQGKHMFTREGLSYAQVAGKQNERWVEKKYEGQPVMKENVLNPSNKNIEFKWEKITKIQTEQKEKLAYIESLCVSLKKDLKFLVDKFVEICEEESMEEEVRQKEKEDKEEEEGDKGSRLAEEEVSSVPESIGEELGPSQNIETEGTNAGSKGGDSDFAEKEPGEEISHSGEDDSIEEEGEWNRKGVEDRNMYGSVVLKGNNPKEKNYNKKKKNEKRKSALSVNPYKLKHGTVGSKPLAKNIKRKKRCEINDNVVVASVNNESSSRTVSLEPVLGVEGLNQTSRVFKERVWEEACKTVELGKKVGVNFDVNISTTIDKLVEMDT